MWKDQFSSYFKFSRKDRSGNLFLIGVIVVLWLIPFTYPYFIQPKQYDYNAFKQEIAALQLTELDSANYYPKNKKYQYSKNFDDHKYRHDDEQVLTRDLFYFDPNTLDEDGWKRLGIKAKTVRTIKNYLNKGGKFRKPEDLAKVWGLSEQDVDELTAYVRIAPTQEYVYSATTFKAPEGYENKKASISVEINTADTSAFISLPGIGSKLAQRIITFREKLGGFYSIQQVGETFGLPDSTFQKIKTRLRINDAVVKQLNINTATLEELKAHPYIRFSIANAIVQYRTQHGQFTSLDQLKKLVPVTEEIFVKLLPYLML